MTLENLRPMVLATAVLATAVLAPTAADAANRADALWTKPDAERNTDLAASSGKEAKPDEADPSKSHPLERGKSSDTTDLLGHSLAAVLVILVLGAAAVFVVKRLLPRLGASQGRRITVLETVYLGPRKNLYVVQVGERTLLVSGTRERLGLLADVTGSVPTPDEAKPPTAGGRPAARFQIPEAEPENA
ncbi:MAG: flagellar biosynthetic protein FliO [Planctomycetota bacterium]|nr:flagellar biosynthetic protein FliO [Planctomycetota bacterium]